MAVLMLNHSCEIGQGTNRKKESSEIDFLRSAARFILLDFKRNTNIRNHLISSMFNMDHEIETKREIYMNTF